MSCSQQKTSHWILGSYVLSQVKATAQQQRHPSQRERIRGMTLCSSYTFDAFGNRRPFLVEDLASAVRTLHPDVLHIELDCFLTQTTFIPGHFDSSSTGDSTGSPLRIRSAVTPEGVVGRYAPPAKTFPHFEHFQILVLVRCTAF